MTRASKIISDCLGDPRKLEGGNKFLFGVEALDGADSWFSYIKNNKNFELSPYVHKQFIDDMNSHNLWFMNGKPGIWVTENELPEGVWYRALKEDGSSMLDKEGRVLYKNAITDEVLDWGSLKKKEGKNAYFKDTRWGFELAIPLPWKDSAKRMVIAPTRWYEVRHALLNYVPSIRNTPLMTEKGYDTLEYHIQKFINNIETGKYEGNRWETIYNLFGSAQGNHWYLMSKVAPRIFDRIVSDVDYNEVILGYGVGSTKKFNELGNALSIYANKARGGQITVLDAMGHKYANELYGKKTNLLFTKDPNTGEMVYSPTEGFLTKEYLLSLSIPQQIDQLKFMLGDKAPPLSKFAMRMKIRLGYAFGANLMRAINWFGKPVVLSAFMTFGAGWAGFLPLLALNSGMFVVDAYMKKQKLNGNRQHFMNKFGLGDGISMARDFSVDAPYTLGETARKRGVRLVDQFNQGLFNVGDTLMSDTYRVTQLQKFFEAQFPGIKKLSELEDILDSYAKNYPEELEEMLFAARNYVESSVKNLTTNTQITASLVQVPSSWGVIWQPYHDTLSGMWNFFAGWGYNKIAGAWDIVRAGASNVFHGRIGARYLDELLKKGVDPTDAHAKMVKAYLENEDFLYFINKIYISLILGKYLDRTTESKEDKDNESLWDDVKDIFKFASIFEANSAAIESTPYGAMAKSFFQNMYTTLEVNGDGQNALMAGAIAGVHTGVKKFFRKLFAFQNLTEFYSRIENTWDPTKQGLLSLAMQVIRNNSNGYLHFLRKETEIAGFSYHIPRGPNARAVELGLVPSEVIDQVNALSSAGKYSNLNISADVMENFFLYNMPFFKQWNVGRFKDLKDFEEKIEALTQTQEWRMLVNGQIPKNTSDQVYNHLYTIVTGRLIKDVDKLNKDDLSASYTYKDKETGEERYNITRQSEEKLLHLLAMSGLSAEQIDDFSENIKIISNKKYKKYSYELKAVVDRDEEGNKKKRDAEAEAVRTLMYIESKQPGSSYQALAYLLSSEWFKRMYGDKKNFIDKDQEPERWQEQSSRIQSEIMKEYAPLVFQVDKKNSWKQFMLRYIKETDLGGFGEFVSEPGEYNASSLKLVFPATDRGGKILKNTFHAHMITDMFAAKGDVNASQLANAYSTLLEVDKFKQKDGTIHPQYAAWLGGLANYIYNQIDSTPMDEDSRHHMKMGLFLFGEDAISSVMKDEELMKRDDVKEVLNDWVHHWYGTLKEIDDLVREKAEDDLTEKKWGKGKGFRSSYSKFVNKPNSYPLVKWRDYLKDKAYSTYLPYKKLGYYPKSYYVDYLKESEFLAAKRQQELAGVKTPDEVFGGGKRKSGGRGFGGRDDSGILVVGRRGKSIANYVREDIDKPVVYKTPWRKRWVRKGKGVDPISTTTWKHLSPKPVRT